MLSLKLCAAVMLSLLIPPQHLPDAQVAVRAPAAATASEDLEIIRARVIGDLLELPINVQEIEVLLESIRPDGSWLDIDYTDVSRTGFQHSKHLQNMYDLARAYKKPDNPWYQNPRAKDAALSALDYWLQHDFICDNWWWNEMGTPGRMINILLVLDTDLNETQIRGGLRIAGRANLEASGARPGGDLIQIAAMLGKQALFRRDETVLNRVVSVMADEITVTTGRGLKPDMSFHHRVDNVICTLSYGLGYANAFSYWAVKVAGTKYQFPGHSSELLIDYFLDGICKSMVYGKYPDPGAKNRDLSRKGTLNAASPEIAENLLMISDYRRAELEEIVSIRKGLTDPNLSWNRFFWNSEYFTHQRPGYFTSVRMHSSRNHTVEQPHNEEGLKMHHIGDGANFISLTGQEYLDIFPVWDWQKIPGTTTVQKPQHPHWNEIAKKGLSDFVGGVTDGRVGAAAFDFKSAHDPLKARKAWFFFDKEYVCLGSGVTSDAEYAVVTTLNQRLLSGEVIVKSRRDQAALDKGLHLMEDVSWVYHDRVGYVFPQEQHVSVSNARASGKWKDINHQASSSDQPVELDVFSLWIDHGVKPRDAQYEYIVVPATTPETLDQYTRNSPIEIISNTASLQAARHKELNTAQVVFYQPGKVKVDDHVSISTESACMVLVKTSGKSIEQITVSDPSRKLDSLQLRISVLIESSGEVWQATWDKKAKESVLTIDLPREGYAGESVVVNLLNQ